MDNLRPLAALIERALIPALFLAAALAASLLDGNSGRGDACAQSVARGPEMAEAGPASVHLRLQEN
jgi:hypothetical protein